MGDFIIGADKVTKLLGVTIIVMGGVVWADLRVQSMRAAEEATEAAAMATKALEGLQDIITQHEYRLRSLEDRVSLIEGRPRQGPPGPIDFQFRGRVRKGEPKRDIPRPPRDPPTLPDPPRTPAPPENRDKKEKPEDPIEVIQ